ncbi:MAG: hypothetical protein PHO37_17030 [Kiritimatiellae bacterium]|nr:hypothetical protein [Kiritimatiellia bacterium]
MTEKTKKRVHETRESIKNSFGDGVFVIAILAGVISAITALAVGLVFNSWWMALSACAAYITLAIFLYTFEFARRAYILSHAIFEVIADGIEPPDPEPTPEPTPEPEPMRIISADQQLTHLLKALPAAKLQALIDAKQL